MVKYVFTIGILIGLFMILTALLGRLNLPKPYRFLQMRYVFASVIYTLVISVAFIFVLGGIDAIMSLDSISRIVLEGVPASSYGAAFMILITLIGNILFMTGAVLITAFCRSTATRKTEYADSAAESLMEKYASKYYELNSLESWPFIRPEYILSARWLNIARKALLIIFITWIAFSCLKLYVGFGFSSKQLLLALKYVLIIFSAIYYPLTEMFYFLDGIGKDEELTEFDIDDIRFIRRGSYEKLIPYFENKYGDMIANKNKTLIERAHIDDYIINDVSNQMLRRSNNETAFESIINSIKYNCMKLSETYKELTLELTDGSSVIVNDSIYGEILLYLAGFINFKLSSGSKVLIVTSYKARVKRIKYELKDRLERVNDLDSVWQIETTDNDWADTADILICPVDKLDLVSNREFSSHIGCIIVDDPSGSFVSSEVAQRITYMRISGLLKEDSIQYIFLSNEDNRNLEESLEHIIAQDLKPFKSVTAKSDYYCVVWKNESFVQPQTRIGISPFIGNSSLIALEAANAGVKSVGMWVDGTIPYITYRDVMMQNIDEIQHKLPSLSTTNMNDVISYNESGNYRKGLTSKNLFESEEKNELKFIIEYDVDNNLLSVAKAWSNYALQNNTLVVILSNSYMLRGYFADNLQSLVHSPSLIKQIIPSKGEDVHRSNELLLTRLNRGMRSDYMVDAFNSFNGTSYSRDQVEDCLQALLDSVCPKKYAEIGVYNNFTFSQEEYFTFENNDPQYETVYNVKLTNYKIYDYVLKKRKYVSVRFGAADRVESIPVEVDDVYNHYLPNQIHCFDGEYAVIKEITTTGEMLLERTSPQNTFSYMQFADYHGSLVDKERPMIEHTNKYSLSEIHTDIQWNIRGYYNFKNGSILNIDDEKHGKRETYEKINLPAQIGMVRANKRGVVIRLEKKCENKEKVELTFALMLNELFKTLLPENYADIAAFAVQTESMNNLLDSLPDDEKTISDIIPTINLSGFNSTDYPEIVLFEKSSSDMGLLSECIDEVNFQNILDIMYTYLKWETVTESKDNRYLLFGFDDYPTIFAVDELLAFLESIRTLNSIEGSVESLRFNDVSSLCEYCGRPLGVEYVEASDGRCMCVDCKNQVIQTHKERDAIYKESSSKLIQYYKLGDKPWNIKKVAFKNLDEIKRKTGDSKILGFYHFGKRQLWVLKGVPRAFEFATFAHELVHAWQHDHLPEKALKNRDLCEGHAMWVEIEMCRKEHQDAYADYLVFCLEHNLIKAMIDDGKGNKEEFSYSIGYKEMERRMSEKSDSENAFDIVKKWAAEL